MHPLFMYVYLAEFGLAVILMVRAVYLSWDFLARLWANEPETARRMGMPPDGLWGSADRLWAWLQARRDGSPVRCEDPVLEARRIRVNQAGRQMLLAVGILLGTMLIHFAILLARSPGGALAMLKAAATDWRFWAASAWILCCAVLVLAIGRARHRRRMKRLEEEHQGSGGAL
jgi:hypothetical protein